MFGCRIGKWNFSFSMHCRWYPCAAVRYSFTIQASNLQKIAVSASDRQQKSLWNFRLPSRGCHTHTNKIQKNMFKHDTAPATPNISFSTKYNGDSFIVYDVFVFDCPKCWPPVKNISWERAKKKKKNTKRIITYAWQQVDRFRKVTDPPYADWYILIMKYLRSRCAKPSHRKYYIRCDIIVSLSFFNFFLL